MKALHMLKVAFDTNIRAKEIPAFQAACVQKLGAPELSKNQIPGYYPLIQYKTRRSYQQQQPLMVILGNHPKLFRKLNQEAAWEANLNGRRIQMKVAHAKSTEYQLQLNPKMKLYTVFNYQALSAEHYQAFQACTTQKARYDYLGQRLQTHMLNFANGISWQIKGDVEVEVLDIIREKCIPYQGIKAHCFDLKFKTNVFLPEYIGLGRGLRKGFGTVRR